MARRKKAAHSVSGAERIEALVNQAIDCAKKAKRTHRSLTGNNFYGNKLGDLRADATNAFRDLSTGSTGDTSAMAEMIANIFSPTTNAKIRGQLARELIFSLRTTWRDRTSDRVPDKSKMFFPLSILTETKRGYLVSIGRQMNGCFFSGWYDACAVMMRRLLEVSLIEAFEAQGLSTKIKEPDGTYVQLSDLVKAALREKAWALSRNTTKFLPQLRDVGHLSAHGRYYCAREPDIEKVRQGCRVVVEEFLHHARLL